MLEEKDELQYQDPKLLLDDFIKTGSAGKIGKLADFYSPDIRPKLIKFYNLWNEMDNQYNLLLELIEKKYNCREIPKYAQIKSCFQIMQTSKTNLEKNRVRKNIININVENIKIPEEDSTMKKLPFSSFYKIIRLLISKLEQRDGYWFMTLNKKLLEDKFDDNLVAMCVGLEDNIQKIAELKHLVDKNEITKAEFLEKLKKVQY